MTQESKKNGLSPFTIVLAGIVIAVAITLPLGNRAANRAETVVETSAETSEVASEAGTPASILMIDGQPIQVDPSQHPGAVAVSQQLQIVMLQLDLMETQLVLMQRKLDTILEIQAEVHNFESTPEEE
jgi:hypothetical protein